MLHCAPIDKQSPRVLDAGCGTGIWSIELGISPAGPLGIEEGMDANGLAADERPDAQVRLYSSPPLM